MPASHKMGLLSQWPGDTGSPLDREGEMAMFRIGIDIGGTFTDFAVWRGQKEGYRSVEIFKVPSTPPHFAEGVRRGLRRLMDQGRIARDEQVLIVHGTTVSTNAVIERSGPPLGLLTTRGFRDILEIARLRVENPVDLFAERPKPLIPANLVFEVDERLLADGTVDRPLCEADVLAAAERALAASASAIVVCFLHAYRNPAHEIRSGEILRAHFPKADIVLSHEVWAQEGEYERANATLLNAYARAAMVGYLGEIEHFLKEELPNARLLVTKSNGGAMAADEANRLPIHTLLSGPAAGVSAAAALGGMIDETSLLTMDMGGTSTDISIIRDGKGVVSHEGKVGDFPITMPVSAIEAIGAGGGSIAWLDGPILKVGPRSAGASPGPACYGKGGVRPTLSDAYLLCGYLSEDAPLSDSIVLRRDLAETAIRPLAEALGFDLVTAAESCVTVATANMLANTLPFIARLGIAPRELTLMVFGGAGGVQGPLLASEIDIGRIVVPRVSSVFCAFGCLVSDLLYDLIANVSSEELTSALVLARFAELRRLGTEWLARQAASVPPEFEYFAHVRYRGQSFDVDTQLDPSVAETGSVNDLAERFHAEHARLFKHSHPAGAIEVTDLRLRVRGALERPAAVPLPQGGGKSVPGRRRRLRFQGRWHDALHVRQDDLGVGWHERGPVVIEQETATTIVPPDFTVTVGPLGDLILERIP
jgi:N-methylhydantoinase A